MLKFCIAGFAERATQREVTQQAAGRRGALDLFANGAKGNSRNACCFEDVR
jgi:hypothetical protein